LVSCLSLGRLANGWSAGPARGIDIGIGGDIIPGGRGGPPAKKAPGAAMVAII
jgi:hypothetical protein